MSMYVEPKDVGKYTYDKKTPKFDFHPNYKEVNDIYVACNHQGAIMTGKEEYFMMVPYGRYGYFTIILHLGDKGLLIGDAYTKFQRIKKQLMRTMIKEFKYGDLFHSQTDRVGIAVKEQNNGFVIYEKQKVPDGKEGKYWQYPIIGRNKLEVSKFAMAVIKLNPERYRTLISPTLLI